MNDPARADSELRRQALLAGLTVRAERLQSADGESLLASGVGIHRASTPGTRLFGLREPSLQLVLAGRQALSAGARSASYAPGQFLLNTVALPFTIDILEASPRAPYLSLTIELRQREVQALLLDDLREEDRPPAPARGAVVADASPELLDPIRRLVELGDVARDVRVLAPLARRELLYRLATGGGSAGMMCGLVAPLRATRRMARAVAWIRAHATEPLRIPVLAREVGMSPSGLHHGFRAVTGLSPLQFQKEVRLRRARELLRSGDYDASTVALEVGYGEPSQFSREYRRLFGAPPMRDLRSSRGEEHGRPAAARSGQRGAADEPVRARHGVRPV